MARSLETKVTFLADAKQLLATTKNIDRNLSGLGGSFAKLGKFAKLGGITFGITKVIGFLKQSVVAANDTAKAQARLDQIFRNSGNKSLALFKELSKEARKISINIGLDDKAGFASQPTEFPKTPLKMMPCTAFFLDWLIDNLSSLK